MRALVSTAFLVSLLAAGCTSVTEIRSDPPGAVVTIDGTPRGRTPLMLAERVTDFTRHTVEIAAPGYRPVRARIGATQWDWGKVGAAIVSVPPLSLLGLFAATDYPMAYEFTLAKAKAGAARAQ